MAIDVTCPACHTRFQVSEKFAGKSGPCPKCKKTIKVPEKKDEVVIHAPEVSGPKDSTGVAVLKPIGRTETRLSMMQMATIFGSIVVPFCTPVLVTLAIFTFMGTWNDFLWPLIVLTGEDRQTLPVALANLAGEHVQDVELMMAGAVLTVLPIIVMFLALQRYYIEGIVSGSVKE